MKNKFITFGVAVLVTLCALKAKAATFSAILSPNQSTNSASFITPGALKVTQIILAANGTNTTVQLYDAPTNTFSYVVSAYTNYLSYQTNYITLYTNFFGVVNSFTNVAMVDYTNSVGQATNNYVLRVAPATAAGTSTKFDLVNYYFQNGILFTNNSAGTATISITYQQ